MTADALTDGAWRAVGGVLRWVPDPEPERGSPADLQRLIACPTCRAKVTESCRSRTGHTRSPHRNRLAPRLCPCGELLPPRRRLCNPCAAEALRVSKRDHLRRLRGTPPERYREAS